MKNLSGIFCTRSTCNTSNVVRYGLLGRRWKSMIRTSSYSAADRMESTGRLWYTSSCRWREESTALDRHWTPPRSACMTPRTCRQHWTQSTQCSTQWTRTWTWTWSEQNSVGTVVWTSTVETLTYKKQKRYFKLHFITLNFKHWQLKENIIAYLSTSNSCEKWQIGKSQKSDFLVIFWLAVWHFCRNQIIWSTGSAF